MHHLAHGTRCLAGEPLGGVERCKLLSWQGVQVGVMGLVESEWIETLASVEPSSVDYIDFVELGRKMAEDLRVGGGLFACLRA